MSHISIGNLTVILRHSGYCITMLWCFYIIFTVIIIIVIIVVVVIIICKLQLVFNACNLLLQST